MGVKDVDLVVPTPTPEQRVSDHGLRDKRNVNRVQEKVVLPKDSRLPRTALQR